jgi:acyl-CoA thioester hydrolase
MLSPAAVPGLVDSVAAVPRDSTDATLEHRVRVQLRWRDMDMLGHLNQSVYHELLEEGRAGLITEILRRTPDDVHGSYVVVHVDLDYRHEVRRDHVEVEVVVTLKRVGTSSLELTHEIRLPDGTVAASGTTVLVAWDPVVRGKRTISEAERAALT